MSNNNNGWPAPSQIEAFVSQFHNQQQTERTEGLHNVLFSLTVAKMACEILASGKQNVLMLRGDDLEQAIQFLKTYLTHFSNELAQLSVVKDKAA